MQKTEQQFIRECFAVTLQMELVWRARPASHFSGNQVEADKFNAANAGKVICKMVTESGAYWKQKVQLNDRTLSVLYITNVYFGQSEVCNKASVDDILFGHTANVA